MQIVPDADESTLRITGYGLDKTPPGCCDAPACTICGAAACGVGQRNQDNHTEQTDSGPYQAKVGTTVKYVIDTTRGNSGSAVEHEIDALVYAIHTHGGCDTVGVNHGTAVDHGGLQDALGCPIGVCAEALVGACCIPDGSCRVFPEYCCTDAGGTFLGGGTTCIPSGACCMGDGSCDDGVPEGCCLAAGGAFLGAGSVCETQVGACCLQPTGPCIDTFESCCDAEGGLFFPTETCARVLCPTLLGPQPGG